MLQPDEVTYVSQLDMVRNGSKKPWALHLRQPLCDVADAQAKGRVVSTLEGGYDLTALAASVAVHVDVLMERGA